jgi:hypothetical protein
VIPVVSLSAVVTSGVSFISARESIPTAATPSPPLSINKR